MWNVLGTGLDKSLGMISKLETTKIKAHKCNYTQEKVFYTVNQTINSMKTKPTVWECICKPHLI